MKKVWRRVKEVFGFLLIVAIIICGIVMYRTEVMLNIIYDRLPQYAYLDKYILKDGEASLQSLIEFSNGGEGEKKDFVRKKIHFAAYLYENWANAYVYKGYKTNEITADWQELVQGDLGGFVALKWEKEKGISEGYVEIEGVITDIQITDEITPEIYVKKMEKKDFEDIEWEDWQVMTKKDFKVKKKIKPDIEMTKGGIKRHFKSIEFSDMGAELTFIPEKLKQSSVEMGQGDGVMGVADIKINGKKYKGYPKTDCEGEDEYISKETIFIKGAKPQGTLEMQISIVGSEKPEIIKVSLDDAR